MNWNNVFENALGNGIADLLIGVLITYIITDFFSKLNEKNKTIGGLVIIDSEIQVNKHILEDVLNEMLPTFEKEMKRGTPNEIPLDDETSKDAARFMRIPIDGILYEGFRSNYVVLGAMQNSTLSEKIINLYTVEFHYRIQTAFRMEQLNWKLLDNIKKKLNEKIKLSEQVLELIGKEIKVQKKRNIMNEVLNEIKLLVTSIFKK